MGEINRGKIFISYRREGGQELARLIHDHLSYRGYEVFLDTESLGGGTFNTVLLQRIRESSDFILILTPGALDRCVNKSDWVRQELACALANKVNIVPVLSKDFTFPEANTLPPEISAIVNYNGPTVNHEYFTAFVDKLENCLRAGRVQDAGPVSEKKPRDAAAAHKRRARLFAAAAVLLLLGTAVWFFISNMGDGLPPVSERQTFGSSAGNLCNEGLGSSSGAASSGSATVSYIHSLDGRLYWYSSSKDSIMTSLGEEEPFALLENVDVGFLSVSTDWFYYTLRDNDTTLYRARRLEEGTVMGEAELLVSGISRDNDIIVEEDYAYYWRSGRGLIRLPLTTTGKETLLVPKEAVWELQLMGKSADWIYGYDQRSIWRINALTGEEETVLLAADHFTDRSITGGNAQGDWIYFVLRDAGSDAYPLSDKLYRIHIDGSSMELLFTAEQPEHELFSVCVYDEEKLILTAAQENSRYFYRYNTQTGSVTERIAPDSYAPVKDPGFTVGNSLTNLANSGVLLENAEGNATYLTSSDSLFFNRLADGESFYYYSANKRTVRCQWNENGSSQNRDLLTDVTCRYLCVTPDAFYCLLEEDGRNTLYFAENDVYAHSIGDLHVLAENVAAENGVAIANGWIYYWVQDQGLYQMSLSVKSPTLIYALDEGKGCRGWHTFALTDKELYFYAGNGLYRVDIDAGKLYFLLDGSELYSDGRITTATADGSAVYYAVAYLDSSGNRVKNDEIWRMDLSDKSAARLYTMSSAEDHVSAINLTTQSGYARIERGETVELHRFSFTGNQIALIKTY